MAPSRLRTLAAAGTIAGLALAFAPALPADEDPSPTVTAADLGLDFAPQLVTVDAETRAARDRVASLGLDVTEHAGHDFVEVVLHTAEDAAALRDAGFTWDVRIADLVARESERQALDAAFAERVDGVSALPSGRTTYRTLADFGTEIDALVEDNPDIARRISIGTSLEGRDLTGIELGVGVDGSDDGRPVFLMFGAHHAREWPSATLPMEFAIDLVDSFNAGDERVVDLLTRGRAVIVPVSNPDGYSASRQSSETFGELPDDPDVASGVLGTGNSYLTPTNAYKRKNCRYVDGQSQPAGTCEFVMSPLGFGTGIDLNRNYGALWGGPGASSDPTSATYHGPAPFSEPETQAIRDFISSRQVTTVVTNHTFSNLILRPVGVQPATTHPDGNPVGFAPDECFATGQGDNGMQALGERMAAQTGYSNQFGWELYDTTGTTEDYSYNATGGYGYTFEIGPDEFHPPFEQVVAEYTGETEAAESVTADNAHELTTAAGDDCGQRAHDLETLGGGNREAFLLAFENAVDAGTHSVITGEAPAGATLTLERSGTFPLWDGTQFPDTVATSMVARGGEFAWHVNPSTRPFVQSRKAPILSDPRSEFSTTDVAPPSLQMAPNEHEFVVAEDADILFATVQAIASASGLAVNFAEYHLTLLDPDGNEVASATEFGPTNTIGFTGVDDAGVPAGTYTLRVGNSVNPTGAYTLTAATHDVLGDATPRSFETWTMRCVVDGEIVGQRGVAVDRGESVDVGDVCA